MINFFKKEYMVEAYGKLPVYKDYINVITSSEAKDWQDWLLRVFGEKRVHIPDGIWHFLFKSRKDSALITGIILQSSDGRRRFPFSLFANLGSTRTTSDMKWAELFLIRDVLGGMYSRLSQACDIDACYQLISGTTVTTRRKLIKMNYIKTVNRPNLTFMEKGGPEEYPVFCILSESDAICLSRGTIAGNQIISKWNLSMYGPSLRVGK